MGKWEELKAKAEEYKKKERGQAKLHARYEREKTERFRHLYEEQNLEDVEFQYNVDIINHHVNEWLAKIDDKHPQSKVLGAIRTAAVRILAYQINLKAKLSRSIVNDHEHRRLYRKHMKDAAEKEVEIERLKKEVERLDGVIKFMEDADKRDD